MCGKEKHRKKGKKLQLKRISSKALKCDHLYFYNNLFGYNFLCFKLK